jgi:TonB family protein
MECLADGVFPITVLIPLGPRTHPAPSPIIPDTLMKLPLAMRLVLPAMLLSVVLPSARAEAQRDTRFGSVYVRADSAPARDRGLVIAFADTMPGEGALMWACGAEGGPIAAVRLYDRRRPGARHVVWRFDGDAPDTTVLRGAEGSKVWFPDDADARRLTQRARTAERLVLTAPGDLLKPDHEFRYALGGVDSALARLPCGSAPADRGRGAGRAALELAWETPWLAPDGTLSDGAVQEWPRLVNPGQLQGQLQRNYPPELRAARVAGEVELKFRVMEDGGVDSTTISVVRSSHPEFAVVGTRVVRFVRFRPARIYGRPVAVWVTQPFSFQPP